MNREQMIAWLTLEGVYVQYYRGHSSLLEAHIDGQCATCAHAVSFEWAGVHGEFDGGPDVDWEKLSDEHVYALYALVVEYKGESK